MLAKCCSASSQSALQRGQQSAGKKGNFTNISMFLFRVAWAGVATYSKNVLCVCLQVNELQKEFRFLGHLRPLQRCWCVRPESLVQQSTCHQRCWLGLMCRGSRMAEKTEEWENISSFLPSSFLAGLTLQFQAGFWISQSIMPVSSSTFILWKMPANMRPPQPMIEVINLEDLKVGDLCCYCLFPAPSLPLPLTPDREVIAGNNMGGVKLRELLET